MGAAAWVGAAATTALRRSSPDELASGVARYLRLVERGGAGAADQDEVISGLAPFLDCARRLGEDPGPLFERASAGAEPSLAELARELARREDVDLGAFGWRLDESPLGPEYTTI